MRGLISKFLRVSGGNVAITFGLAALPMIFGLGMGIDYSSATQRRLRMNAAADAAALFAVNPTELTQPEAVAAAAAKVVFDAQVTSMAGIQYVPLSVTVTIPADKVVNGNKTRTVTVSYQAKSTNAFSGILGVKTTSIAGTAGSSAAFAPNIDFYLMLDTSPSMAIGATTADMNKLMALTPNQGGCAFACHESNAAKYDTGLGNPKGVDNYKLAKDNGLRLRIDVVNDAVGQMISSAQKNPPAGVTYRMGSYTFDYFFNQLAPPPNKFGTGPYVTTDLSQVQSLTSNLQTVTVFKPGWITPSINDNEADTNFDLAMNSINAIMPTPGNGTSLPGDTPQEVLFIVSDGVIDEPNGSVGSRIIAPIDTPQAQSWCTTVKNRGIRIAFLYTTYIPIPSNGFYNQYVAPFQSSLGPVYAQNCASAGLYTQVNSDDDITAAMQNLFNAATKTARLTQ